MSRDLYWIASSGPVRWKMYTRRYWAIRSVSLASDQIIVGIGMAFVHLLVDVRLPLWFVSLVFGILVVKDIFVMWPCIAVSRLWPITGREGMIGKRGEAASSLDPAGIVKVDNEIWRARTVGRFIEEGEGAEVVEVEGLTLRVRPVGDGE